MNNQSAISLCERQAAGVTPYNEILSTDLQRHVRVQYKLGDLLPPRQPLPGLVVQEVVKDRALRGKLDVLKFCHPPLAELHTIVHQLWEEKDEFVCTGECMYVST